MTWAQLSQLLQLSRPWSQTLTGGLVLLVIHMGLTALLVPLSRQLAPLIQAFAWPDFLHWLGLVLLLYAGRNLCLGWQQYVFGNVSLQAAQAYQLQLHHHLLTQISLSELQQQPTGDWLVRLQDDIDKVRVGILKLWSDALPGLLLFISLLGLASWYNWRLTFILIALLPLLALLLHLFGQHIQHTSAQVQHQQGHTQHFLWESLQHWLTIISNHTPVERSQQFQQQQARLLQAQQRLLQWTSAQPAVTGFAQIVLIGVLLLYSGWEIAQGWLTGADLLAFATAIALSVDPILMLTGAAIPLQIAAHSLARLKAVEKCGPPPPPPQVCSDALLKLESVMLTYPNSPWHLKPISLALAPGERSALVGPSGAGKSTLLLLAAGLWPLTQGQRYMAPGKKWILLPQKPPIFSLSLQDNITLGRAIDPDKIAHLLRICQLEERLQQWPQGPHTPIGSDGMQLSGGEKQLVAMARALAGDPDGLLLDEATSELDATTETRLLAAINEAFPQLAWLMVAHRFSSLRFCHRRYVMSQGALLAEGQHEDLLAQCPLYRQLWEQGAAPVN